MSGSSRRRAVGVLPVACMALVLTASVASAAAPTKVQGTVEDDFSTGSIRFDVSAFDAVVSAGTYKLALSNESIGPHFYVAVGGLPEDITVDQFIEVLDPVVAGAPPPEGVFGAGDVFAKPGQRHQAQFDLTAPGRPASLSDTDSGWHTALQAGLRRTLRRSRVAGRFQARCQTRRRAWADRQSMISTNRQASRLG